jgi:hypothetical protein
MELDARVLGEPGAHVLGIVRGRVVEHHMERAVGIGAATFFMKRRNAVWLALSWCVTWPVAISSAAKRSITPWRR